MNCNDLHIKKEKYGGGVLECSRFFKCNLRKKNVTSKIRIKSFVRTSRHSIYREVVSRKSDFLCGQYKKVKFRSYDKAFYETFFCLFYIAHKNVGFPQNFMLPHKISWLMHEIFVMIFLTFKNVTFRYREHMHLGA